MSIHSRQYFRSIGKSLHHQFKNHQNKPGVMAVLMKNGRTMETGIEEEDIWPQVMAFQHMYIS